MAKVYIGVGHGGTDFGACANGLRESELALDIAIKVKDILDRHGVPNKISRTNQGSDAVDDLVYKIQRCNEYNPDLAIDIHINAGGGVGFEAFYYHKGGTSLTLAKNIETEVKQFTNSRGLKTKLNSAGNDYFGWIRQVNAPSVILEAAFVDNSKDVQKVSTENGRQKFATAYAKGILNTLNIPYKENVSTSPAGAVEGNSASISTTSNIVYKTISDVPDFGKATIKKLYDKGVVQGDGKGNINLPHETVRILVFLERLKLF